MSFLLCCGILFSLLFCFTVLFFFLFCPFVVALYVCPHDGNNDPNGVCPPAKERDIVGGRTIEERTWYAQQLGQPIAQSEGQLAQQLHELEKLRIARNKAWVNLNPPKSKRTKTKPTDPDPGQTYYVCVCSFV